MPPAAIDGLTLTSATGAETANQSIPLSDLRQLTDRLGCQWRL